jgi:hypothetical protein
MDRTHAKDKARNQWLNDWLHSSYPAEIKPAIAANAEYQAHAAEVEAISFN